MTLAEQARTVQTREDLVAFILALSADLKANPEAWENADLASFLGDCNKVQAEIDSP